MPKLKCQEKLQIPMTTRAQLWRSSDPTGRRTNQARRPDDTWAGRPASRTGPVWHPSIWVSPVIRILTFGIRCSLSSPCHREVWRSQAVAISDQVSRQSAIASPRWSPFLLSSRGLAQPGRGDLWSGLTAIRDRFTLANRGSRGGGTPAENLRGKISGESPRL